MSEIKTYSDEQTPLLIERLKSMVLKNMKLIDAAIIGDITEEKYYNVLRGRKAAAQDCVWAMNEISELEQKLNPESNNKYYREMLPDLIEKLKGMVDENMTIIDTDIDNSITEDKYLSILKARKTASEDCRWAMGRVDFLEKELNTEETEETRKLSWAKRAADSKR